MKKRRNIKNCMHRVLCGGLQGQHKCWLLLHTKYGSRPCKGVCTFYDEGVKNKQGVVIGITK